MSLFFRDLFIKTGLILMPVICFSSCAVHGYFPFICFERACVKEQFDIKGFKKRLNGKIAVMKRKNNKRKTLDSKPRNKSFQEDSLETLRGINVDYYRYVLFFRVTRCVNCFDTLLVEHTSEYRTLIETDQSRLIHMIDTINTKNIVTVYIKPSHHNKEEDPNYERTEKHRKRDIQKFLKNSGIKPERIKILQDSLSPPKL